MNDQMMENNQNHSCLCEVINCLVSSCKIGATGPTGPTHTLKSESRNNV